MKKEINKSNTYYNYFNNEDIDDINEYEIDYNEVNEDINDMTLINNENEKELRKNMDYNECNVISLYLKDLKNYKILDKDSELELIKKIKYENDEDAKQKMLLCNLRLVISIAKKFLGQGLPLIDMISEGNLGLIKAIDKFDVTKGYRFSTYAVWWIRQTIKKAIINKGRDIRIPTYKYEKLSKITKVISEYKMTYGRVPSINYISKELNEKPDKLIVMLGEFQEIVSFSEPIGDNLYFEDIIGHNIDIEDKIFKEEQLEEIDLLMETVLNEREYNVIKYRYGLNNNKIQTLKEIGEILEVTRERVRQIEKKALYKLQQHLKK